jgi:hypothetical protein
MHTEKSGGYNNTKVLLADEVNSEWKVLSTKWVEIREEEL